MYKHILILCFCVLAIVVGTTALFRATHTYDNLLNRADELAYEGKFRRAIPYYRSAHGLKPEEPAPILGELRAYQSLGETRNLERFLNRLARSWLYERIITQWPPNQKRELAGAFYGSKDFDRAEPIYQRLWHDTAEERDGLHLAEVLAWQKKHSQATHVLQSILKKSPNQKRAKKLLADVMSWDQRFEEAIPLFRQLVLEEPNDDSTHLKLAGALRHAGRPEEAAPILESLSQKYPNDREILFERAKTLGSGAQYPTALEILSGLEGDSIEEEKSRIDEMKLSIRERHGLYKEVEEMYRQKLGHDPKDASLRDKFLGILETQEKFAEALSYCKSILADEPENEQILRRAAHLASWVGLHAESAAYLEKLSRRSPMDQPLNMELASEWILSGQTDKGLSLYEKIVEENPADAEASEKFLQAFLSAKPEGGDLLRLKSWVERHPDDDRFKKLLADILSWKENYPESLRFYLELRRKHPEDADISIQHARILSWSRDYRQSETEYKRLIQKNPDWVMPRRELGRILGWSRQYDRAVRQYEETQKAFPDDLAVRAELESKKDFYRFHDGQAMKHYQTWLSIEPMNVEAMFDLGQVYSRQRHWQKARSLYKKILSIQPSHFRAEQALNKVNILDQKTTLTTYAGFEESDAGSRLNDVRLYQGGLDLDSPINEQLSLRAGYSDGKYEFSDFVRTSRHKTFVEALFYGKPFWWGSFGYEYSDYSRGPDGTHNFHENIHLAPRDDLEFVLSHQRQDLIYNSRTLIEHLQADDLKVRGVYRHSVVFEAGADYLHQNSNDGNSSDRYGGDIKFNLSDASQRLSVQYRYEEYGYAKAREYYFSPSSFHTHSIMLEYRRYLNKEELFWGTNDTYFTVRYKLDLERNSLNGHQIYLDFHHDWNDRFSTHLEGSTKLYNENNIYEEKRIVLYTVLRF